MIRALESSGHHAQHRRGPQVVGDVLDDGCRVGIGPVQVLEHEHTPIAGDRGQETQETLADLHRARGIRLLTDAAPLGNDRGQCPPVDRRPAVGADPPDVARQRLEQRTERHRCARVDGPSDQHWQPSTCGRVAEFPDNPRLADTRLACHPDEAANPSDGPIESGLENRCLVDATDNRRAGHR